MSIVSALLEQVAGSCELFGRDLRALDQDERGSVRGESIGFVFQVFNLLPALTAEENVAVPLLIHGVQRNSAIDRARAALADVGLEGRTDALPGQLSGGEQQRVAIARALVHNPRLIVCDEPTSSLDHQTGLQVMTNLRAITEGSQRTMIVVTHDARILQFADRVGRMEDGRIVSIDVAADGDPLS